MLSKADDMPSREEGIISMVIGLLSKAVGEVSTAVFVLSKLAGRVSISNAAGATTLAVVAVGMSSLSGVPDRMSKVGDGVAVREFATGVIGVFEEGAIMTSGRRSDGRLRRGESAEV